MGQEGSTLQQIKLALVFSTFHLFLVSYPHNHECNQYNFWVCTHLLNHTGLCFSVPLRDISQHFSHSATLTTSSQHSFNCFNMCSPRLLLSLFIYVSFSQALLLLAYLIRNGSERVVTSAREHIYDLRSLENYHFIGEFLNEN